MASHGTEPRHSTERDHGMVRDRTPVPQDGSTEPGHGTKDLSLDVGSDIEDSEERDTEDVDDLPSFEETLSSFDEMSVDSSTSFYDSELEIPLGIMDCDPDLFGNDDEFSPSCLGWV